MEVLETDPEAAAVLAFLRSSQVCHPVVEHRLTASTARAAPSQARGLRRTSDLS